MSEASQRRHVIDLVSGKVQKGSSLHIMSWSSHRSRCPVTATLAAELLAASEALEETVILKEVMRLILGVKVLSMILFDLNILFRSWTLKKNLTDNSLEKTLASHVFFFETSIDEFVWNAGPLSPTAVGTQKDSPPTEVLVLTLATKITRINFTIFGFSHRSKPYG